MFRKAREPSKVCRAAAAGGIELFLQQEVKFLAAQRTPFVEQTIA